MSVNERTIAVPPEVVWSVMADAKSYERWVVGAKKIRGCEGTWPQPGARFHHSLGVGPLVLRDSTEVLGADPLRRLELRAGIQPIGTVRVAFELHNEGARTRVVMTEEPVGGFLAGVSNAFIHLALRGRNAETLSRLDSEAQKLVPQAP